MNLLASSSNCFFVFGAGVLGIKIINYQNNKKLHERNSETLSCNIFMLKFFPF
jgi:hypothetical protein